MSVSPDFEEPSIVKDVLSIMSFRPGEPAYAIDAKWFNAWKRSIGYDSEPTNEKIPPIDNSNITNYLEKAVDVDFIVIPAAVWNGLINKYQGGPAVEVEVGYDPKTGAGVPVTKLHSFKVHYQGNVKKIMISKFMSVENLIKLACEEFQLENPKLYTLRDYWQRKIGKYLFPNQIICEYSLFVNTDLLLQKGEYPTEEEISEATNSQTASNQSSSTLSPFPQAKTTFASPIVLTKPEFNSKVGRRGSVTRRIIEERRTSFASSSVANLTSTSPTQLFSNPIGNQERVSAPLLFPKPRDLYENPLGIKGLVNLTSTSFIESILQCLVHVEPLKNFFLNNTSQPVKPVTECPRKCRNCNIVNAFSDFVKSYYNNNNSTLISPYEIKTIMEKFTPDFAANHHQDSHQFLTDFLNLLNEQLRIPHDNESKQSSTDTVQRSMQEWIDHVSHNDSIITEIFHGQSMTTILSSKHATEQVEFSPFTSLLLNLPSPTVLSSTFLFAPADPSQPRSSLRIPLIDKKINSENFALSLSEYLQRPVNLIYGMIDNENNIDWITGPEAAVHGKTLIAYEVKNPNSLHMVVRLAVNINKLINSNKIIDGPFLVEIPGQDTTHEQALKICDEYFSYLYEPSTETFVNPELGILVPNLKNNPTSSERFDLELSKSIFSKTMRFKPLPECPIVAARTAVLTILKTEGVFWQRLMRTPVKNSVSVTKKDVNIINLIEEAGLAKGARDSWRPMGEEAKTKRRVNISKIPKVLILALRRFETTRGSTKKNDIPVVYPDEIELSDLYGKHTFQLIAVCEHGGKIGAGHYSAHAKIDKDTWAEFNEKQAYRCTAEAAHQPNAYIIFYQQVEE